MPMPKFSKEEFKQIVAKFAAKIAVDPVDILRVSQNTLLEWQTLVGQTIAQGALLKHNGNAYLVMQDVLAQTHQAPDAEGMFAIYRLFRGNDIAYDWVQGEYAEIGYLRIRPNGNTYEAYTDPNANIHPPEDAPSVWRVTA